MRIEKIEWRNIFSYGNKIETLDLGSEGKLWQLSGVSGSGKSSLLTIPKLLLYGKTEGSGGKTMKLSAIANRVNKNGWIRGTIKHNQDTYVIERTFSPQSLTVYKNGQDLDKAGLKDMQGIIDSEILDNMPYHIFANVMTLSLNNFKSFVSMTPADKRQIIDKIFSLEIINKVHELIKRDMRDLGNAINISNSQIFSLDQTIKTSTDELNSLSNKHTEENKNTLEDLKVRAQKAAELYAVQQEIYNQQYNKYNEILSTETALKQTLAGQIKDCNITQQKINLFNQDKCPTCGTAFNSDEFVELKEKLQQTYAEQYSMYDATNKQLQALLQAKNEIWSVMQSLQENLNKIRTKQNEILSEARGIELSAQKTGEFQSIQKIISDTQQTKKTIEKEITSSNKKMGLLTILEEQYSADGIKRQMMQSFIPTLNEEIATALSRLGFPYTLEFDDNFDPHLESLGESIETETLSVGEHKKVDLIVLCAILKMLKRKYPQINLICLDETVSSLDYESSTDIISYLKEISSTMGLNVFIVSHTQLEESLFDVRILVTKNAGFSELTYL